MHSKTLLFELCSQSRESARAAERGGADRIELCSGLDLGGITPGPALIEDVIQAVSLPIHVLIRPRPGDFVYSSPELTLMLRQVEQAKQAGAAGVTLGVLLAGGRVDVERTLALVEHARPMQVTFHRAFDETRDLGEALEDVILTGADYLLTSGGVCDVLAGAETIARLARQAGERIQIIAGGGLRLASLPEVIRRSGIFAVHGSLTRESGNGASFVPDALERDIREAVRLLRAHSAGLAQRPMTI